MSKKSLIITSAVIAAVSSGVVTQANAAVKCYGVSKAGENKCNWPGGTCMGSSPYDCNGHAWTMMKTKGACLKTTCTSKAGRKVTGTLKAQDFIDPDES